MTNDSKLPDNGSGVEWDGMTTSPAQIVAQYLRDHLDVPVYIGEPPEPDEDYRTLVRIGGVAVGAAVAREVLENGRIVYEVEPFPAWAGPPQAREEIHP